MAVRLLVVAAAAVVTGGVLAAAGLVLLAQLIGGLALVPLSLASYLMLLPAQLWTDDGGGWHDGDHPDGPDPAPPRGGDFDWPEFERQFWARVREQAHVRERQPTAI